MRDRYAGDIGDYGKIGLLKCLKSHGFDIGVNWYRIPTPNMEKRKDGTYKQKDGKFLISECFKECDPVLAEKLTEIAIGDRTVEAVQNADLIPDAIYYDDYLTVEGRNEWHKRAIDFFSDVNLVFIDPDNGLLVKSVNKYSAKSVKYVFYEEVKDYIDCGKSVLVYNHRSRKPEREYFKEIDDRLQENVKVYHYMIQKITFPRGTIRDYFAIPTCKEHFEIFRDAFAEMKSSRWGELGVCRLFPEWDDDIHKRYKTYDEHVFLDIESEKFNEDKTFEDYRQDVIRYLMLCGYNYSESSAISVVNDNISYIKGSFKRKVPVSDIAIDIGYGCG